MSKAKIVDKKSIESILGEKRILTELHHPFIVNMIYSFQDLDYLYLVMEILPGGNLRYHLSLQKTFNENQIKFIIGCIMIGLKYIHRQKILHRDIKPENLVFDQNGYLRITDFGIAKHYVVNNKKDTSGTIGYLAPEVLCNVNHNYSIDYYAVGIITYELMYGHRPYIGKNKHEVKQLILTKQAKIEIEDLPEDFSHEIADFINRLIQRKPVHRLGKNDINEVVNHPWFNDFDWDNCSKKQLNAPYVPKSGDNFDKNYCLQSNKIGTETMERYEKIMAKEEIHLVFKEFNCNIIPKELKGYSKKKRYENKYSSNNNISSNMSTTSISRNNRNEQNNLIGLNNMKGISKNIIKNKILNNDLENLIAKNNSMNKSIGTINKTIFEMSQNKYIEPINNMNKNNFNVSNKIYKIDNNNNLEISTINQKQNHEHNISSIQKSIPDIDLDIKNINLDKNNLFNYSLIKKKEHLNRNASARNINRNRAKLLLNNSTIDKKESIINFNSSIIKNIRQKEMSFYKNKKDKYLNQSTKMSKTKRVTNNINNDGDNNEYYNKINKNIILQNKKNTSISIPKTKKDFIKKELLNNKSIYYPIHNRNNSNMFINPKRSSSTILSSTIYSKKKNSSLERSRMYSKRLTSSDSMNDKNENNFLLREKINDKTKIMLMDNINTIRSSKNIINYDKKLPFLHLSMVKKKTIDNNERNDINFNFNKYKNNKNESINDKSRNGLNYDFLTERIKNKRVKSGQNFKL